MIESPERKTREAERARIIAFLAPRMAAMAASPSQAGELRALLDAIAAAAHHYWHA